MCRVLAGWGGRRSTPRTAELGDVVVDDEDETVAALAKRGMEDTGGRESSKR